LKSDIGVNEFLEISEILQVLIKCYGWNMQFLQVPTIWFGSAIFAGTNHDILDNIKNYANLKFCRVLHFFDTKIFCTKNVYRNTFSKLN
jgi:hypothetical protein